MADGTEEAVEARWSFLTQGLPPEVSQRWWATIRDKYRQPHRKYHNMEYVQNMFALADANKFKMANPEAVYYALLFQHLEYDPQSADNEDANIQQFREFAKESGTLTESPLCEQVVELIGLTSTHITEEHKTEGAYGSEDKHYFLDFDMSYLGGQPPEYSTYAKQIQEEYSFLPERTYKMLRSKILKSFLQIPNIFATKQFRDDYEKQARSNIQQEIAEIAS